MTLYWFLPLFRLTNHQRRALLNAHWSIERTSDREPDATFIWYIQALSNEREVLWVERVSVLDPSVRRCGHDLPNGSTRLLVCTEETGGTFVEYDKAKSLVRGRVLLLQELGNRSAHHTAFINSDCTK